MADETQTETPEAEAPAEPAQAEAPQAEAPQAEGEAALSEAPQSEAPAADEQQAPKEEGAVPDETRSVEMHDGGQGDQDRASREDGASAEAPGDDAPKPKRRRSRGKGAKAWGMKAAAEGAVPVVDLTSSGQGVPPGASRPKGKRPPRPNRPPREKGPLPFNELREAAKTIMELQGARPALRDAFAQLAQKERTQISEMVAADQDFRVRARSISAGSLSAGKLGKALAAQQVAIAEVEDLWSFTLSKEDAAARQARVRNAKRRDDDRAKRQAERRNSSDRISKEDMEKARDGRVGAQVRIVVAGENDRDRKKTKKDKKPSGGSSVLDRLGY